MALQRDLGPTGSPNGGPNYASDRGSSRWRCQIQDDFSVFQPNHVYGFTRSSVLPTTKWTVGQSVQLSWASWGTDADVRAVELTYLVGGSPQAITSYTIWPQHLNISATILAGKLYLVAPKVTKLYIEANGDTLNPMLVFSDEPCAAAPTDANGGTYWSRFDGGSAAPVTASGSYLPSLPALLTTQSPNVQRIVLGPGIWTLPNAAGSSTNGYPGTIPREFGSMLYRLPPFTELWLERGAWVIGSFDLRESNNVTVRGPGVLSAEWISDAQIQSVVQGSGNQYTNAGNTLTFGQKQAFSMWLGKQLGDAADFEMPAMYAQDLTVVGCPFYHVSDGLSACTNMKVLAPWNGNCDGFQISNDSSDVELTREVTNCFAFVGDDGLAALSNVGSTFFDRNTILCAQAAPLLLGYFNPAQDTFRENPRTEVTNCIFGSINSVGALNGPDLFTAAAEGSFDPLGGYSAPSVTTNTIIKLWNDGDDDDAQGLGRANILVDGVVVDGPIPQALFAIENCYYFGNAYGNALDKAGDVRNITLRNITTTHTPFRRSRLIGRDRKNTPRDITFENVVIAGEKLTTWTWSDHVVMNEAPYNIIVEGRLVVTAVEVCNLALAHIGETAEVSSIAPPDGSAQASLCNRFFNQAVEELLAMHPWSFATKRVTLTEDATNDVEAWDYSYEVPADIGRVLQIMPPETRDDVIDATTRKAPAHTIEQNSDGELRIYTNVEDAVLRYSTYVYDATKFPTLFVTTLTWMLASKLAGALIKGDVGAAEAKRCLQMVQFYLGKATSVDGLQRNQKPTHSVPWISQR